MPAEKAAKPTRAAMIPQGTAACTRRYLRQQERAYTCRPCRYREVKTMEQAAQVPEPACWLFVTVIGCALFVLGVVVALLFTTFLKR
jgi:hypothetical protein